MTVTIVKPQVRGVQIIEQNGGLLYSLYTESGPWIRLEDETLLGKDLTEQEAFDMADTFKPDFSVKAAPKIKTKPKALPAPKKPKEVA